MGELRKYHSFLHGHSAPSGASCRHCGGPPHVGGQLALGIGATTAVFAVVDATLLRPLACHAPERLVGLNAMSGPDGRLMPYSLSQIELVRKRLASVSPVLALREDTSVS